MNDYLKFWESWREPFLTFGTYGPAVFLVALSLALELAVDNWIAPTIKGRFPGTAGALTKGFNGVRAGIFAGGFAALTTLQGEYILLGAVAGVVTVAVRALIKELNDAGKFPPSAALLVLACFGPLLGGCDKEAKINIPRELCYSDAKDEFRATTNKCETNACIDEAGEVLKSAQEACE